MNTGVMRQHVFVWGGSIIMEMHCQENVVFCFFFENLIFRYSQKFQMKLFITHQKIRRTSSQKRDIVWPQCALSTKYFKLWTNNYYNKLKQFEMYSTNVIISQ